MTLLLASVGFVSRSPTETWWFPSPEETAQLKPRSSGLRRFDFGPVTSAQSSRYRLALLAAIVLVVAFISSGAWMTEHFAGLGPAASLRERATDCLKRVLFPLRDMLSMREDIASDFTRRALSLIRSIPSPARKRCSMAIRSMRDLIRSRYRARSCNFPETFTATTFAGLSAGSKNSG
jgi:hypothetical protein